MEENLTPITDKVESITDLTKHIKVVNKYVLVVSEAQIKSSSLKQLKSKLSLSKTVKDELYKQILTSFESCGKMICKISDNSEVLSKEDIGKFAISSTYSNATPIVNNIDPSSFDRILDRIDEMYSNVNVFSKEHIDDTLLVRQYFFIHESFISLICDEL